MGPRNICAHTLSTWSLLHSHYLLSSLSVLCDGVPIVPTQKLICLKIVLSTLQHVTSSVSDWENTGIHRLQFVYFRHSLVILLVWQLVVSIERSVVQRAAQLCSSSILMRWILMNPCSTCWSLIPIQKGLVFKFIIDSGVISGLSHAVCHGIVTGNIGNFFICLSVFVMSYT